MGSSRPIIDEMKKASNQPNIKDETISKLQEELAEERDARREERFAFFLVLVIIFDIMIFTVMPGFGGPFAIVVLEFLVFILLAKRMGLEHVAVILNRVLARFAGELSNRQE